MPSVERLGIGDGVLDGAKLASQNRLTETSTSSGCPAAPMGSGSDIMHTLHCAGGLEEHCWRLQKRTAMQVQFEATKKRAAIALGDKWEEVATIGLAREFSLGMGGGER